MTLRRSKAALLTVLWAGILGGCGIVAKLPGVRAEGTTAPGAVLLVRTPRHLAMALKSGATLRTGPEVRVVVVEIIVCDEGVKALVTDAQLAMDIAAARGHGIHTRACGLSLERFGVDATTLPAGVNVVPNGLVENLRLQALGFLAAEL